MLQTFKTGMFLFGFLSSTAPYVIMLLAYLFLFFSGATAPEANGEMGSVVHQVTVGDEVGSPDQLAYQACQVVAVAPNDQPNLETPCFNHPLQHFSCIPSQRVEKAFVRFSFSLPPPVFC